MWAEKTTQMARRKKKEVDLVKRPRDYAWNVLCVFIMNIDPVREGIISPAPRSPRVCPGDDSITCIKAADICQCYCDVITVKRQSCHTKPHFVFSWNISKSTNNAGISRCLIIGRGHHSLLSDWSSRKYPVFRFWYLGPKAVGIICIIILNHHYCFHSTYVRQYVCILWTFVIISFDSRPTVQPTDLKLWHTIAQVTNLKKNSNKI